MMVVQKYKVLILVLLSLFIFSACDAEDEYEMEEEALPVIESDDAESDDVEPDDAESRETDWIADYEEYIQKTMDEDHIPGVAVAIVQGDEIIFAEGYGLRDIAANAPVTTETLFHIGSTHKSMTAMMTATLVDDDLLQWDEPIVTVYPEFALSDPDATEEVTMRHLLSMRGGISEDAEDELGDGSTPADVFEVIGETDLLGMPGEEFSYSNISASVAGYVDVLASGGAYDALYEGYADLLQKRVLDPIGMKTAVIYASEAQRNPDHAESYTLDGETAVLSETYDFDGDALAPSGSLKANVVEMALYVATQLNGGIAPNGNRVVSSENLKETWIPYLENYGMGWEITTHEGMEIILHTGSYDDFSSVIGFFPEQEIGFVILLNSEEAGDTLIEDAPYILADMLPE